MSSGASFENSENACVVCFKNVTIYSVGECDHPVCYECSTRMRVLCRQNECPICRQDMPKVIFMKEVKPFATVKDNHYLMDKKFKICFENQEIQAAYSKLLEHVCTVCPGSPAFRTFQSLKDHMRRVHELHYCDLCVENLKIFTGERRCYTRQELAQHRRKGDPDDRSHRGHPLCEFCDQRYMDNDELYRHLRRDHLYCHFCDADGYHQYYSSYDFLRDHFRAEHFLCEEGSCMEEKFTSVFRSAIDLKAHRASVHGRSMGRAALKQARTLELEFTLAPRPGGPRRGGGHGGRTGGGGRHLEYSPEEEVATASAEQHTPSLPPPPPPPASDDFPALGGATAAAVRPLPLTTSGPSCRGYRPPSSLTADDFPALDGAVGPSGRNTVRVSVNGNHERQSSSSNVSISVNRRPDGGLTTRLSTSRRSGKPSGDDFPALGCRSSASAPVPSKKASSLLIPMPSPWQTQAVESPAAAVSLGSVKVKSKKKKAKGGSVVSVNTNQSVESSSSPRPGQPSSQRQVDDGGGGGGTNVNSSVGHTAPVERKRSQLLITGLNTATTSPASTPIIPSSGASTAGLPPPPGFKPPGVATHPPPGFSVTLSSVARGSAPTDMDGLTFTSSSGRNYAVGTSVMPPSEARQFSFVPPPGADHRNRQLVAQVADVVPDLETFLRHSAEFRRGALSAKDFYDCCVRAAGERPFAALFPELLVLLPDIAKQQELWSVYSSPVCDGLGLPSLDACTTCAQVLAPADLRHHQAAHRLDNQFPALGAPKTVTGSAASTQPTWVRKQ